MSSLKTKQVPSRLSNGKYLSFFFSLPHRMHLEYSIIGEALGRKLWYMEPIPVGCATKWHQVHSREIDLSGQMTDRDRHGYLKWVKHNSCSHWLWLDRIWGSNTGLYQLKSKLGEKVRKMHSKQAESREESDSQRSRPGSEYCPR